MYDLVISGGTVVDGTGSAPFAADVAIDGDRIVAVGEVTGAARRRIDADGALVTPGWVDVHTHYDGQVTWDPVVAPSSVNGVTSVVTGSCGVGFAPAHPDRHDWLISLLEGVEDIPGSALAEGLPWDWESFPEYLDAVDRRPHTVDIGAHVPHAPLRAYVMGDRGADHRVTPTHDEIAAMRTLVAEALDAGAIGFATSRTIVHRTGSGDPVGTMTSTAEELVGIAGALTSSGRGVVQLVSDLYLTEDPDQVAREVELLKRLAREVRRPLSFTVEQVDAVPDRWRTMMALVDDLCAEGLDVKAQVAPRPIGLVLGLSASVNPFQLTRAYREVADLPVRERAAALREPGRRRRVLDEHRTQQWQGFTSVVAGGFGRMFPFDEHPDYEPLASRSLAGIAAVLGRSADEVALDAFTAGSGDRLFYCALNNFHAGDLSEVYEMLTSENILFGLSDGGAHCNFICDATFPTTAVAHWARDRTRGPRLRIEQIVHHQTQRTAAHVGWLDRGVIAPGYLADVNLIDFDRLRLRAPEIVTDLPAGGSRLVQGAEGYVMTLKSGIVTFVDGQPTGEHPGRVVRGAQPSPTVRGGTVR